MRPRHILNSLGACFHYIKFLLSVHFLLHLELKQGEYMARNKKKKRIQSPKKTVKLSPAAYIRKKARNLPISKCYVQSLWKDTGMSSVFVTRAHKNGNLTVGLYLVDLKCLGIKNALYQFNIPEFRLQE